MATQWLEHFLFCDSIIKPIIIGLLYLNQFQNQFHVQLEIPGDGGDNGKHVKFQNEQVNASLPLGSLRWPSSENYIP